MMRSNLFALITLQCLSLRSAITSVGPNMLTGYDAISGHTILCMKPRPSLRDVENRLLQAKRMRQWHEVGCMLKMARVFSLAVNAKGDIWDVDITTRPGLEAQEDSSRF